MKTFRLLTALTLGTLLWGCAESGKKAEGPFYTDIESRAQLHDWFRYAPERPIVVSGHRGGMMPGYPENCIESCEKTLSLMPTFFEIDFSFMDEERLRIEGFNVSIRSLFSEVFQRCVFEIRLEHAQLCRIGKRNIQIVEHDLFECWIEDRPGDLNAFIHVARHEVGA